MVNGTKIFNVSPKVVTNFSCYDRCQRILLPSPSRMQRNMGPGPKWNILFKCYWSEWYRIKEKEVLNNLQCTSIMFFFFRKLIFQGPPLDNKLWNAQKKLWGKPLGHEITSQEKPRQNEKFHFKKDNNNSRVKPQFVFISHLVIPPSPFSSYPPFTIPRLQTNHDYCADQEL